VIYHVNIHLHGHQLGEYLKGQNGSCQVKAQEQGYNFRWGFCMFWFIKDGFIELKIKCYEMKLNITNAINHVMTYFLTCNLTANGGYTITIIQNI